MLLRSPIHCKICGGEVAPARLILRREKINDFYDPLFIGVYPAGIVYSDRTREEYGDFKRLGFLSYSTLMLQINDDCPADLSARIKTHAGNMKHGQKFNIDSCGSFVILGE